VNLSGPMMPFIITKQPPYYSCVYLSRRSCVVGLLSSSLAPTQHGSDLVCRLALLKLGGKMQTRTKIDPFTWALSKDCVPKVGSLIKTHLGVSLVMECHMLPKVSLRIDWLPRAISEVGEDNALSLFDVKKRDPFFEDGEGALVLKVLTDYGPVWLMMQHTHYNRVGPIFDKASWHGNFYPTFTERDSKFNEEAA